MYVCMFHVNVCYNLQPLPSEPALCVQWNSIFFQAVSARCSGLKLH